MKGENHRPKWKFKKPQSPNPFAELIPWVMDKDKRATLIWASLLIGGAFIAFYYMSLGDGFTPSANIIQSPILVIRAFIMGILFVFVFSLGMFAPVITYRICGVNTDEIKGEKSSKAIDALIFRSVISQVLGASITVAIVYYAFSNQLDAETWNIIFAATVISIVSVVAVIYAPRVTKYGYEESQLTYWATVSAFMLLSVIALFAIFFLALVREGRPMPSWQVILIWLVIVFYTGIFSTLRRTDRIPAAIVAFVLFVFSLAWFNVTAWPLKMVAYEIGIAERFPVTLVLPTDSCKQVQKALRGERPLQCDGEDAGILLNVLVRNSWGDRWNIRAEENSESIIFDGKGVLIRKEKPKKSTDNTLPFSPLP